MNPSVLYSTSFSVVKKLMVERARAYQDFPSKTLCLTVPRIFVWKHFSVSLLPGAEEVWIREGEAISRFSDENFLSHSAENFSEGTL